MKKFPLLLAVILLVAFTPLLNGCASADKLPGKWNLIGIKGEKTLLEPDIIEMFGNAYFEFYSNGGVFMVIGSKNSTGGWTLDGNNLTVTEGGTEFSGSFTNKRITLVNSDVEYIFERPKDEETGAVGAD